MSEEDIQRSYRSSMILIEAARVLSSAFPSTSVVLTGQELEILRNIVGYATRRETFVREYHDSYYLVADDDDWTDIGEIVATLEEKIMGSDNTVFGYYDRLFTREDHTTLVSGPWVQSHPVVPEGEVWAVQGISLFSDKPPGTVNVYGRMPTISMAITDTLIWTANLQLARSPLTVILKEDDKIQFAWAGLANDQRIISNVWGYIMNIPG